MKANVDIRGRGVLENDHWAGKSCAWLQARPVDDGERRPFAGDKGKGIDLTWLRCWHGGGGQCQEIRLRQRRRRRDTCCNDLQRRRQHMPVTLLVVTFE